MILHQVKEEEIQDRIIHGLSHWPKYDDMRKESHILSLIRGDDCDHSWSIPGVEGRGDKLGPAQMIVIIVVSTPIHTNLPSER